MLVRAPTARTAPQQVSFRRDDAANCRLSLSQPGARRRRHRRDAFSVASGSGASVPEQSGAAKGAQAAPPGDRTDAGAYASCSSDSSPRISVVERRFSAFFQEVLTQEKEDEWESVRQKVRKAARGTFMVQMIASLVSGTDAPSAPRRSTPKTTGRGTGDESGSSGVS